MNQVKILYLFTSNEGEQFDDNEGFAGVATKTTLREAIVSYDKVAETMESIWETAADYGDGVTDAEILAIVDAETNEVLPKQIEYWEVGDSQ